MEKSKMKTVFIFIVVVVPVMFGTIKFFDYRKAEKNEKKAIQEQKLIYESLSSRMSKELGLVKDDFKYYLPPRYIDEMLSKKEMTIKELSEFNIEMQKLLRNKEFLMENKKNIEEAPKIYLSS